MEKDLMGQLHVYVKEPPLEGRANKTVVRSLGKYFGVKENRIFLIRGQNSKIKVFEIDGVE